MKVGEGPRPTQSPRVEQGRRREVGPAEGRAARSPRRAPAGRPLPLGPTWLRPPGPRLGPPARPLPPPPALSRPMPEPPPPPPHLVEGEELLLELLALWVGALPPEPKLHHLASGCRRRARRRRRPQDAPRGPAGPEARAGRQAARARAREAGPARRRTQTATDVQADQWMCPCAVRPAPTGQTMGEDWAPGLGRARETTPAEHAPRRGACRDL